MRLISFVRQFEHRRKNEEEEEKKRKDKTRLPSEKSDALWMTYGARMRDGKRAPRLLRLCAVAFAHLYRLCFSSSSSLAVRAATLENSQASKSSYAARRCIEINADSQTPKRVTLPLARMRRPSTHSPVSNRIEEIRSNLLVHTRVKLGRANARWLNYHGAKQKERESVGGKKRTNEMRETKAVK